MENNKYINLVFVVDASSSMISSKNDVIEGFNNVIKEQRNLEDGKCSVSLFTFASDVKEVYLGKDVSEINDLEYLPGGMTAMNDGIGTAIDKIGSWLDKMEEEDKPSKTMVVIMTDGEENFSKDYTLQDVQDKIKHQTEKYSWEFVYIGTDITSQKDADSLGINTRTYTSRNNYSKWADIVNTSTVCYRKCVGTVEDANFALNASLCETTTALTNETENELGIQIK